jgi:hypothetical protein
MFIFKGYNSISLNNNNENTAYSTCVGVVILEGNTLRKGCKNTALMTKKTVIITIEIITVFFIVLFLNR